MCLEPLLAYGGIETAELSTASEPRVWASPKLSRFDCHRLNRVVRRQKGERVDGWKMAAAMASL